MSRPASAIGHGALGVRSGLRTFDELSEQTYCERRGYADLLLGRQVGTTWNLFSGFSVYVTSFTEEFDGVPLEVAAVVTASGDSLDRVEAVGDVTENTFYFEPGSPSTLYVFITGGGNPNDVAIRVDFIRKFGSVGSVEPLFGPEKLTNADLQEWTSPTDLAAFNEVGVSATNVQLRQIVVDGRLAVEIIPGTSGQAAGSIGGIQQAGQTAYAGELYWFGIEYSTAHNMNPGQSARLRVRLSPVGDAILEDGRSQGSGVNGHALLPTGGQRRRAIFPFLCPADTTGLTVGAFLHNPTGGTLTGTGGLIVYRTTLRRVYRYELVEPRLAQGSLPEVEIGSADVFMGAEEVSFGGVRLLNFEGGTEEMARGYLETLLGSYDVCGRYMPLGQGGSFDDGQEITRDDFWDLWSASVFDFDVGDLDASFQLREGESVLSVVLPVSTVGADAVSMNVSDRDEGRPLPILIGGPKFNMRPPRVDLNLTTRLPVLLVNDPAYGNGTPIMGQVAAWAYADDDAADRRDTTRRVACSISSDTATGLVTLTNNPGPFEIFGGIGNADVVREVRMNDALDIVLGGNTYVVYLTPGLYTIASLCAAAEALLDALPEADVSVSYSTTTHQVTVSFAGASMTIPLATGANRDRSAWPMFGFEGTADLSGLTQVGIALYDESRADQFIIRVDATGYRDHTDGRYTGVTGGGDTSIIYKMPSEIHFLWHKILGQDPIDLASFVAARQSHQTACTVYLGGLGPSSRLTVQEIFDRAEATSYVDLSIDNTGRLAWRPRAASASQIAELASLAPTLTDRDFLEFRSGKSVEDVIQAVVMEFDEDPVTGEVKTREAGNGTVSLRHDQRGVKTFHVLPFFAEDAQAQAWNELLLGVLPRRRVRFRVKGRLLKKTTGDVVRVQRTRILGPEIEGMLNEDVFRILTLKKDPQTHVCTGLAYTADLPRNLDAVPVQGMLRGPLTLPSAPPPYPRGRQIHVANRPGLM